MSKPRRESGRRIVTGLSGILAIDKPAGVSSHDCVAHVRRVTGERRVGHAGTLDPAATGLMLVCVGPAARLSDYLISTNKSYLASIVFGMATDTDDACGKSLRTAPLPTLQDAEAAQAILNTFLGCQQQLPPLYSAIKTAGVAAYKQARAGKDVPRSPRSVEVFEARLLRFMPQSWDVSFVVSKGTYVRALARDIGEAAGSAAHLGTLRRVACGGIGVDEAVALEAVTSENFASYFINPLPALGLPVVELSAAQRAKAGKGAPLILAPAQRLLLTPPAHGETGNRPLIYPAPLSHSAPASTMASY